MTRHNVQSNTINKIQAQKIKDKYKKCIQIYRHTLIVSLPLVDTVVVALTNITTPRVFLICEVKMSTASKAHVQWCWFQSFWVSFSSGGLVGGV